MNKYFLETSPNCFEDIQNFPYKPNFIKGVFELPNDYNNLKVAYIDENKGGRKGVLLMIHGHPTWSYLWRHLIPFGIKYDYRVIAIDLPGFGRSDKPIVKSFFKFSNFRRLLLNFIDNLNLKDITLFCHEWGGTIGLTLPMENISKFEALVVFNSYFGNSLTKITDGYMNWINTNINSDPLNVRALMARTNRILNLAECNAYEAPYPDKQFKTSLQLLPGMFPLNEEYEGFELCKKALDWWDKNKLKKVLVIGGGRDPLVPVEKMRSLSKIISTDNQTHVINNAGHFVPEWGMEFGEELFENLVNE